MGARRAITPRDPLWKLRTGNRHERLRQKRLLPAPAAALGDRQSSTAIGRPAAYHEFTIRGTDRLQITLAGGRKHAPTAGRHTILVAFLSSLRPASPLQNSTPLSINQSSQLLRKNSTTISSFSHFSSLSFSFCCYVFFSSRSRTRFRHRESRSKSNDEAYIKRKRKNGVDLNSRKRVACRRKSRWDLEQRRRRRSARARAFSLLALLR